MDPGMGVGWGTEVEVGAISGVGVTRMGVEVGAGIRVRTAVTAPGEAGVGRPYQISEIDPISNIAAKPMLPRITQGLKIFLTMLRKLP